MDKKETGSGSRSAAGSTWRMGLVAHASDSKVLAKATHPIGPLARSTQWTGKRSLVTMPLTIAESCNRIRGCPNDAGRQSSRWHQSKQSEPSIAT